MFDLIVTNAILKDKDDPQSIAVKNGVIEKITPHVTTSAKTYFDAEGYFLSPGFFESHIHLDKACILNRSNIEEGTLDEAVDQTGKAKRDFTESGVFKRGAQVIEMAIKKGTLGLRTFVESDPKTGLRSFEAIKRLKDNYAFALDVQICTFAQEGLTDQPKTKKLLKKALESGADLIGGCPYKDAHPEKHIEEIFDLAEAYNVDVDFHLDFDLDPHNSSIPKLVEETLYRNYKGRVSIGHVTKLAAMPEEKREQLHEILKKADITLTVLPATDIFLNGRGHKPLVPRGFVDANALTRAGVYTTISSNNILNAFTPYGDASLLRMANMYANLNQLAKSEAIQSVYNMVSGNAAKLLKMNQKISVGSPANFIVLEAQNPIQAIRTIAQPLAGFKNGIQTFSNPKGEILV